MCGMPRSLALSLAVATLIGCSSTPEQPLLQQFFAASRLRDNTMLAGFAATAFEPGVDGIVTTFSIANVTPEQRKPLPPGSIVVDLSINGGPAHVDVSRDDGELVSKEVSISAPVKLPSGQTVRKNYLVTMQRAILRGGKPTIGRWIITGIREAAGAASTPRS